MAVQDAAVGPQIANHFTKMGDKVAVALFPNNDFGIGLKDSFVAQFEANGGYNPRDIYNNDGDIHRVLDQMVDGTYASGNKELFRELYNSLLDRDVYFILKDFRAYADAQARVKAAYKDTENWTRMAMRNTACSGKFSSDRTIEEYVRDIWHLEKVILP